MPSLNSLVRRYPLTSFAVLACVFGWMVYGLAAVGIGSNPANMPLGPLIAAAIVAGCQGRGTLRAWGRSLGQWRASPWLYAVAVLAPVALVVCAAGVNHLLGAPLPTLDQLGAWPEVPVTFLVMLVAVGIGEEAGWTAFAAPTLIRRHGVLAAWGILAAVRILWHLPLMLTGELGLVLALAGMTGFQLIAVQLLRARRGGWTLVAVWHATLNATGGAFLFTMVTGADQDRLGVLLGSAYLVAALATLVPAAVRQARQARQAAPAAAVTADPRPVRSGVRS